MVNEGNRLIDSYIVIGLTERQWWMTRSPTCQKNNWPLITFRLRRDRSDPLVDEVHDNGQCNPKVWRITANLSFSTFAYRI